MERGSVRQPADAVGFANDLAELGNQALREKYPKEASSHAAMKRRCRNGDFDLDPAWNDFRSFLRDVGPRVSDDATLDRKDPALRRYGPGLCRWATKTEQTINRRNTVWVDFRGERIRLREFAQRLGAPYSTIQTRIKKGETPEAIARHYAGDRRSDQTFRPGWINDDTAFQRWRANYEVWLRRVRRDRRSFAPPEVYAVIVASEAFDQSRKRLDAVSDEVAPSEAAQFETKYARDLRISSNAPDWIKAALRSLAERDARLANRLAPRHGEWRELWKFEKWLIPPPDER